MEKLGRDELIELAYRLIHSDKEFDSEEEFDAAIAALQTNVPDPEVTDYIFWPNPIDKPVDSEEVIDRALAYQPVQQRED